MHSFKYLIDHQLKMCEAPPLHGVVFDILGPGLALNGNHYSLSRVHQLNKHSGAHIPVLVLIREIVHRKSLVRVVFEISGILNISRVLAVALDPDAVVQICPLVVDVVLHHSSDLLGNLILVQQNLVRLCVVGDRSPAVDAVQLEDDAWSPLPVPKPVLGGTVALEELVPVNLADLLVSRLLGGQLAALNAHVLHSVVLVRL